MLSQCVSVGPRDSARPDDQIAKLDGVAHSHIGRAAWAVHAVVPESSAGRQLLLVNVSVSSDLKAVTGAKKHSPLSSRARY